MRRLRTMLRSVKAHPVWGAVAFASLSLVGLWAFVPQVAHAGSALENALIQVVGFIIGFFVNILGAILIKFIGILVTVAQFNNFIDAPAVKVGWSVTRDISNMFFIVALLLIAVGTMFRIDQYRYSRTLQKLIMMAILINFSKAIAGFFIDFSQVVMLTFVNAFKDQAAGSLSAGFGIDKLLTISSNTSAASGEISTLSVLGSLFAALIMVFVATVIVGIFTVLLIQRIIMLWIYIVLAPTAYMVAVLPGSLGSWWSSWWRDFSQYLIKGPVIAFFLWLALTIITLSTTTLIPTTSTVEPNLDKPIFVNEATSGTVIINYLVAIGMLIAGLQQAAKSSGAGGALAGKWMGNFNKWGSSIATSPIRGAKGVAGFAGRRTGDVLKRPGYAAADAGLGLVSKVPGLKNWGIRQRASLNATRLSREDKDTKHLKFAKDEELATIANSNVIMNESGRNENKGAIEELMRRKRHSMINGSSMDRYKKFIKYSTKPKEDGTGIAESAMDQDALKLLQEHRKERPDSLYKGYESMSPAMKAATDAEADKFLKKLKPEGFEKIDDETIKDGNFGPKLQQWFAGLSDNSKNEIITRRASQTMRDFLSPGAVVAAAATTAAADGATGETRAHEDIDRERQARTAARVAAFQKRNLNFHESDEYLKNQGQFYDQQSYATNLAQEERRVERENLKKHGVSLPVTGASTFASGSDNTLGVSEEVLNDAGVRLTAAGTVTDPADKQKLADALSQKLTTDIADVEHQLATAPQDILDSVQEGSGTGTTVREALQMKVENLKGTQERLQDTAQIGSLKFINADRFGGNVRTAKAEEDFHEKIEAMDADRSFRNQLWSTMAPAEQQKIVQQMRDKTKRQDLGEAEAFDEYLAKGLTNLTRETWADTGPDAVKLGSGLALQVQRQAEAKQVKLHDLTLLQQQAKVQVPSRFATVGAETRAVARGAAQSTAAIARGATQKVTGVVGAAARGVSSGVSKAVSATTGAASAVGKKTADVAAAPYRAVQGALGRRASEQARVAAMKVDQQKTAMRYTPEELQQQKKNLAGFERQSQQVSDTLMQEYQEQEQVLNTSTNRLEVKTAKEKMQRIRGDLKRTSQELKGQRQIVADYEAGLQKSQANLGEQVGKSFRRSEQADVQRSASQKRFGTSTPAAPTPPAPPPPPPPAGPAPKSGSAAPTSAAPAPAPTPKATVPPPPAPPAAPTRTAPTPAGAAEASDTVETETAPNVTNITNVTQNIQQVFKGAPADVRANLTGYDPDAFNKLLNNTPTWRVLKDNIEKNAKELMKSEKMSEVGRIELQKRITSLGKHFDENNAPAFTEEFKQLKNIFSSGSSET